MNSMMLLLVLTAPGIDYGWQPGSDGKLEYILQLEPAAIDALRAGKEISSDIHPEVVQSVRRFVVRAESPQTSRPTITAAPRAGSQAAPSIQYGWKPGADGELEYYIQMNTAALDALRRGQELSGDIHPDVVGGVKRLVLRVGEAPLPRILPPPSNDLRGGNRVQPASGTSVGTRPDAAAIIPGTSATSGYSTPSSNPSDSEGWFTFGDMNAWNRGSDPAADPRRAAGGSRFSLQDSAPPSVPAGSDRFGAANGTVGNGQVSAGGSRWENSTNPRGVATNNTPPTNQFDPRNPPASDPRASYAASNPANYADPRTNAPYPPDRSNEVTAPPNYNSNNFNPNLGRHTNGPSPSEFGYGAGQYGQPNFVQGNYGQGPVPPGEYPPQNAGPPGYTGPAGNYGAPPYGQGTYPPAAWPPPYPANATGPSRFGGAPNLLTDDPRNSTAGDPRWAGEGASGADGGERAVTNRQSTTKPVVREETASENVAVTTTATRTDSGSPRRVESPSELAADSGAGTSSSKTRTTDDFLKELILFASLGINVVAVVIARQYFVRYQMLIREVRDTDTMVV